MFKAIRNFTLAAIGLTFGMTARAADTFAVDPVHSSISFMISHADISFIHGRFNDYSGKFTVDKADPAKCSFALSIKTETVDTNNKLRDEHLRKDDYFDVAKYPAMTFQSTKVKAVDGGYEVSGDLSLHGVTKEIALKLKGGDKTVEFPKGMQRIGFETTLVIKRSDFGMKTGLGSVGDDVHIVIGVEAVKE